MTYYTLYNTRFFDEMYAYGDYLGDFNTGDAKQCLGCHRYISLMEWLPPHKIQVSKKKLGDFIYGTYEGFIVSERFKDVWQNAKFKGLNNFRKVDVYYKGKLRTDVSYYYPDIDLINAHIDLDKVKMEENENEFCKVCQRGNAVFERINGIFFLNPANIKQDIFFTTSLGQSNIIVSDRFKDFVVKENFTNAKFINCEAYVYDTYKGLKTPRKYIFGTEGNEPKYDSDIPLI